MGGRPSIDCWRGLDVGCSSVTYIEQGHAVSLQVVKQDANSSARPLRRGRWLWPAESACLACLALRRQSSYQHSTIACPSKPVPSTCADERSNVRSRPGPNQRPAMTSQPHTPYQQQQRAAAQQRARAKQEEERERRAKPRESNREEIERERETKRRRERSRSCWAPGTWSGENHTEGHFFAWPPSPLHAHRPPPTSAYYGTTRRISAPERSAVNASLQRTHQPTATTDHTHLSANYHTIYATPTGGARKSSAAHRSSTTATMSYYGPAGSSDYGGGG